MNISRMFGNPEAIKLVKEYERVSTTFEAMLDKGDDTEDIEVELNALQNRFKTAVEVVNSRKTKRGKK